MLTGIRLYGALGAALLLALLLAWAMRLDGLRATYKLALDKLSGEAVEVVRATRTASDNPDVDWNTAAGQIVALGDSNRELKQAVERQNAAIDEMAREAVRLKARAAELKAIADKAQAQRRAALERLSDMAITPGTRADCMTLLREAEEALDLVREAGL